MKYYLLSVDSTHSITFCSPYEGTKKNGCDESIIFVAEYSEVSTWSVYVLSWDKDVDSLRPVLKGAQLYYEADKEMQQFLKKAKFVMNNFSNAEIKRAF